MSAGAAASWARNAPVIGPRDWTTYAPGSPDARRWAGIESVSGTAESMNALRRRIASSAWRRSSRLRVVLLSRCGNKFVARALAELVLIVAGAAAGAALGEAGAGVAVETGRSAPEDPLVPRRCASAFARASSFSPSCQKNTAARKQSRLMMTQVRVLNCIRQLSTKQPFSEGRNPSAHGFL